MLSPLWGDLCTVSSKVKVKLELFTPLCINTQVSSSFARKFFSHNGCWHFCPNQSAVWVCVNLFLNCSSCSIFLCFWFIPVLCCIMSKITYKYVNTYLDYNWKSDGVSCSFLLSLCSRFLCLFGNVCRSLCTFASCYIFLWNVILKFWKGVYLIYSWFAWHGLFKDADFTNLCYCQVLGSPHCAQIILSVQSGGSTSTDAHSTSTEAKLSVLPLKTLNSLQGSSIISLTFLKKGEMGDSEFTFSTYVPSILRIRFEFFVQLLNLLSEIHFTD